MRSRDRHGFQRTGQAEFFGKVRYRIGRALPEESVQPVQRVAVVGQHLLHICGGKVVVEHVHEGQDKPLPELWAAFQGTEKGCGIQIKGEIVGEGVDFHNIAVFGAVWHPREGVNIVNTPSPPLVSVGRFSAGCTAQRT